ncbi:hypothetical protein [Sporolactobacillus sp. KGMB 08714]|uniref:hypothetical protein n=1 Tax=Sporolactobacillus sp. KGMB 08714 TaxID=3064704 RepID=UPI002FBE9EE3
MAKIISIEPTPRDVFASAVKNIDQFDEIMIIGRYRDGEFDICYSDMRLHEQLGLLELGKMYVQQHYLDGQTE